MRATYITYKDASIIVASFDDDSNADLLEQLTNYDAYKQQYSNIITEKRKREFLGVRICLNALFEKEMIMQYDDHNKPILSNHKGHIGVSHSKNWVALIAHPKCAVGIDIECRTKKVANVYKRYLNETEQEIFHNQDCTDALELIWSAKESLYKMIGKEAMPVAEQLRTAPFVTGNTGQIQVWHQATNKTHALEYWQNEQFSLTYCIQSPDSNQII